MSIGVSPPELSIVSAGQVQEHLNEDSVLAADGKPDLDKLRPLVYAPINREYHAWGDRLGKAFSVGMRKD